MGTVERLAFYLLKTVSRAVQHYDLVEDGDRIVVTVERTAPRQMEACSEPYRGLTGNAAYDLGHVAAVR